MNKDYIDKENGKYIVKISQDINLKQDKLISGTNIKTINGVPLLGNGDIPISNNDWEVVNTSDFIRNSKEYTTHFIYLNGWNLFENVRFNKTRKKKDKKTHDSMYCSYWFWWRKINWKKTCNCK